MSRVDLAQAGRLLRDGNGLIGIAVIVVVPIALGNVTLQSIAIFACVYGIIALGITVLHGYAGQFSLAYAVTAGVGAYISAYAAMDGIPTFIAIIFGAIGGGILGILVSGPALRIRGIQLAAVTLALMEAGSAVFSHISGYDGAGGVPLPGVFGYTFSSTQSQILFCGITFALIYLLLRVYLKSIAGKRLLLIKLSEESARSIGVNSVASKVTAFAVSSFAAGLGGALYPLLLQYIDPDSYDFSLLLLVFAVAIIGGMSRPEGAIWGAIFYAILTWIIGSSSIYSQAVFGALMLVAVIASPRVHEFQTIRARHPEDSGQVARGRRVRARLAAGRLKDRGGDSPASGPGRRPRRRARVRSVPPDPACSPRRKRVPPPCDARASASTSAGSRRSPTSIWPSRSARSLRSSARTARASRPWSRSSAASWQRIPVPCTSRRSSWPASGNTGWRGWGCRGHSRRPIWSGSSR